MGSDSLFIRFIKVLFGLLFKLFLYSLYLVSKVTEVILTEFNNLLKRHL